MAARFESGPDHWPPEGGPSPPALGEYEYVFRDLLGLEEDEFVRLLETGAIG